MNRRAIIRVLACAALVSIAGCDAGSPAQESAPLAGAAIGGPFTLVDKDGDTVRWDDFKGQYRAVYFGYTFCPDACPMDVGTLMQGFSRFEKAHPEMAAKVQPIFITIDPARDTPAAVGTFAAAFHPRLLGLTGSAPQVEQAAKAFRVYHARGAQTAGGYLMDHSRIAYLMDPDGKPIVMLPIDKGADAVAADLAKWVR